MAACSYGRPAMRFGMCRRRVAYSRARWLVNASNTMMLRPTVGRLVARVTASDPLALPMKAPIVVTTHDSISRIRAQLRPTNTATASAMSIRPMKASTLPATITAERPPSTVSPWMSNISLEVLRGSSKENQRNGQVEEAARECHPCPEDDLRGSLVPAVGVFDLRDLGHFDPPHIDDGQVAVGDDPIAAPLRLW